MKLLLLLVVMAIATLLMPKYDPGTPMALKDIKTDKAVAYHVQPQVGNIHFVEQVACAWFQEAVLPDQKGLDAHLRATAAQL
jgi:hypothetical protein